MKKTIVGITVVGKDKEGIVAEFTSFVFEKGANVEKVNQNVIKGLFGMYLEVSFTSKINFKKVRKKHLAHLLKKQKFRLSSLMRETKKRPKRNCLKFVKSSKLI